MPRQTPVSQAGSNWTSLRVSIQDSVSNLLRRTKMCFLNILRLHVIQQQRQKRLYKKYTERLAGAYVEKYNEMSMMQCHDHYMFPPSPRSWAWSPCTSSEPRALFLPPTDEEEPSFCGSECSAWSGDSGRCTSPCCSEVIFNGGYHFSGKARWPMMHVCPRRELVCYPGNFQGGGAAVAGWWAGGVGVGAGGAMAGAGAGAGGAGALHYAAARGCLDCVKLLATTTPDVNANTAMDNDVTPVYLAAQEGHLAVLQYLVVHGGGRLDARARDGMLPVHAAAQTGCLDCLKWMIVERGVDPNSRDGDGATPLHFAASRGHLGTVRWLLRHGARLHLDRHGKSPINDAAENHHLECLNVLVAAGAGAAGGAESKQLAPYKAVHACACAAGDDACPLPSCVNAPRGPFFLHGPSPGGKAEGESHDTPPDGLYVNPMQGAKEVSPPRNGHVSSGDESSVGGAGSERGGGWYLHGGGGSAPALYQRVRDLFDSPGPRSPAEGQEAPTMTVKAEVHGGAGEAAGAPGAPAASDCELGDRRDHDYEDIYLRHEEPQQALRPRSSSRDSGSHSRPGSAALIVDYTHKDADKYAHSQKDADNGKAYEEVCSGGGRSSLANKLAQLTHKAHNLASKLSSAAGSRRSSVAEGEVAVQSGGSASSGVSSGGSSGDEAPPPPPPLPPAPAPPHEHTLKPSELRARLGSRRNSASDADEERPRPPNLVNKQLALPFVPPAFPHAASNRLIKPSEYLRSITSPCKREEAAEGDKPPPPPPPEPRPPTPERAHQPLAAISSAELAGVRLRRIEKSPISKTLSAPPARSVSLQCIATASADFRSQKTDLIAELKMSKDITGIRKMKVERAKMENMVDKETYAEYAKRFTADNFVDQIPERDGAGNVIPAWKRQMLARRAAERAKRDLEQELASEAERRRAAAIPAWKRQLMQRREEAEQRLRQSMYAGKGEERGEGEWRASYPGGAQRAVSIDNITISLQYDNSPPNERAEDSPPKHNGTNGTADGVCNGTSNGMSHGTSNGTSHGTSNGTSHGTSNGMSHGTSNGTSHGTSNGTGHGSSNGKDEESEDEARIIPWRAQLRKTNSKLNLLE